MQIVFCELGAGFNVSTSKSGTSGCQHSMQNQIRKLDSIDATSRKERDCFPGRVFAYYGSPWRLSCSYRKQRILRFHVTGGLVGLGS